MNFVKASQKITACIESATTANHHIAINQMIETCFIYAKAQKNWDKTILGALGLLKWQNVNKWGKNLVVSK